MIDSDKTAIEQSFAAFLATHADVRRFWVALSGGLDSCVLLHLVARYKPDVPVYVLHVNHQLSPHARQWQAHCEALAAEYGFRFVAESVQLEKGGHGLEKAARDARYAVFEDHLLPGDMLLMAHHQNDQAETLMLRLLRGTGLRGLGGMPAVRPLGRARAGRPLLMHARKQLLAYAQAEGLLWVEDESNQSPAFDRNYLRLEVMPLLARRWPAFAERFAQTAALLRESEALLNEYTEQDLVAADRRSERLGESLSLQYLKTLSESRRNAVLRRWLQSHNCQPPQQIQLQQVRQFFSAEEDTQPRLIIGSQELQRFNRRLYLTPVLPAPVPVDTLWHPQAPLELPDRSVLRAAPATTGLRADRQYQVRLRQGGERCQPAGRAHSQKLKKLLQEYGLEPWLRDRVPLIYAGDEIAAVGDLWVCRNFYVEGEPAWRLTWGVEL